MKIISKHKDYYDGVVNTYGIDEHVIFIRENKEINNYNIKLSRHIERSKITNGTDIFYDYIYVGYCGLIYPCLKITKLVTAGENSCEYIFNYETIKETYLKQFNQKEKWVVRYNSWDKYKSNLYDYNKNMLDLFHEHKCSSFIMDYERYYGYGVCVNLTIEPILKDIQFFKLKGAVEAFQDISVFVAEQLNTEIDNFVMTDKQKILSRGFDEKYGFRKRPK